MGRGKNTFITIYDVKQYPKNKQEAKAIRKLVNTSPNLKKELASESKTAKVQKK